MKISIDRFLKSTGDNFKWFSWTLGESICLKDIKKAIESGIIETDEPFGVPPNIPYKNINYHIQRVIYFINHPEEIEKLIVICQDSARGYYAYCMLVDGYHRMMAALYLGFKEIDIIYSGRPDVLDYLLGKRKRQPNQNSYSWDYISVR